MVVSSDISVRPVRCSLLSRKLVAAGAELQPFAPDTRFESVIVEEFPSRGLKSSPLVMLCDLSPLPRLGLKGRGVKRVLKSISADCPSKVNLCTRQSRGVLCARLLEHEVLLLAPLNSTGADLFAPCERLCANETERERGEGRGGGKVASCWSVPRLDNFFWLALGGEKAPHLLSKLSAIDFERFERGAIAQTSVARLSVCVIRDPRAPLYHLLGDSASVLYLWECLEDAGREHDVHLVGRRTLLSAQKLPAVRQ